MTIIIFLLILSLLVFVHELGHFLVAKKAGVRVDEFGFGYPPRAKKLFTWKGTDFTLNWLPFGGFVKIFGENPSTDGEVPSGESFQTKSRGIQVAVLVAGVTANLLLAWFLLSAGYMAGLPASTDSGLPVTDAHTVITEVMPGSPAALAGIKAGDSVVSVGRKNMYANTAPDQISNFIASSPEAVTFTVIRGHEQLTLNALPGAGVVPDKLAVGVGLDSVGTVRLSFIPAIYQGLKTTINLTWSTLTSLLGLIKGAFMGHADLSQVTGPVGIVSLVGDARALGFIYLLTFTALISINLAIINLLPIPALDGGRVLFVIIEAIRRKSISPKFVNVVNNASFAILILLMILITIRDVSHLF